MHEMRNAETGEVVAACEITGVHLDCQARKSTPFADAIRSTAVTPLAFPEPAKVQGARFGHALPADKGTLTSVRPHHLMQPILLR